MAGEGIIRLDKWLWFARFCKSRTLAGKLCETGRIKLAGKAVTKANQMLRPGDVLTFPQGPHVRVIEVVALGTRRGPAVEAQTLYADLAPPQPRAEQPPEDQSPASRERGTGRPTKAERRATDRLIDPFE